MWPCVGMLLCALPVLFFLTKDILVRHLDISNLTSLIDIDTGHRKERRNVSYVAKHRLESED